MLVSVSLFQPVTFPFSILHVKGRRMLAFYSVPIIGNEVLDFQLVFILLVQIV